MCTWITKDEKESKRVERGQEAGARAGYTGAHGGRRRRHLPPAGAGRSGRRRESTTGSTTVATSVSSSTVSSAAEASSTSTGSGTAVSSSTATGSDITSAGSRATSASSTRPAVSSTEGSLGTDVDKPLRDDLRSLLEQVDEVSGNAEVVSVEKGGRSTSVTRSSSSTNSVRVLGNVSGKVVQDDVGDVGNVKTSSSNGGRNEDGRSTSLESVESHLSLPLSSVTVNRGGHVSLGAEEVAERVGHALGLDKDEDQSSRLLGNKQVKQERLLVLVVDVLDSLGDVLRGGSNSANREENVVLQEGSGQVLNLLGEGGGEHERLSVVHTRHVLSLDNSSDLRLETHVQHSVGLVEDKVLDVGKRDLASLHEVDKTTGGSRKQVATSVEGSHLLADVGSTVNDSGPDPRSVGELSSLVVDLRDQLSSRGENQSGGVRLSSSVALLHRRGLRTVAEESGEDGEEETTSLSGTGLGTSHEVSATSDDGDGHLLDWGGGGVSRVGDVLEQDRVDGRVGELGHGLGHSATSRLDRDVGILVEIDTGGLFVSPFLPLNDVLHTW